MAAQKNIAKIIVYFWEIGEKVKEKPKRLIFQIKFKDDGTFNVKNERKKH